MATLNQDSTADEIESFIEQAVARLNETDKKGILTCQLNISYNESYFNEKEGELKHLIRESVHALSAAVTKMREIVPSLPSALRILKETIADHIKMGRACLGEIGQILSGGEESISGEYEEMQDMARVYLKCWDETSPVIKDLDALIAEFEDIRVDSVVSNEDEQEEQPDTISTKDFGVADITKRFTDELENQLTNGRKDIEEKAEEQDQETEDEVQQQESRVSVYDENITRGGLLEKADVNYSNHSER